MLPLDRQTVFLTGAAQGLGAAIARHFAARGARLVLFDRHVDGLARTVAECAGRARGVAVDLSSAEDTARAMSKAMEGVSAVDTLIHNAAILKPQLLASQSLQDFRATINVSLLAAFVLTKTVWPSMAARGSGALIFVSSRSGIEGFATEAAYCTAKHGLEGLSKSLAQEGRAHGIISTTITPGMFMRTPSSELTYSAEERLKWIEPDVLAPAFSQIAETRGAELSGQRLNAWHMVRGHSEA